MRFDFDRLDLEKLSIEQDGSKEIAELKAANLSAITAQNPITDDDVPI
jgi:lipase chaperone LimK